MSAVETTANTAKSIAEGRARAVSFDNYSALATSLNSAANTEYKVGDNIFIQAGNVPDLWIYSVESGNADYAYINDDAIVSALQTNGSLQIGYYKVAAMETGKVDLSGYVATSRTINGKALSSNITLSAADVGALSTGETAAKATADAEGNNIASTYAKLTDIISFEEM